MSKTNSAITEKIKNQQAMVEGINNFIKKHKEVENAVDQLPVDKSSGQFKRLKDALTKYKEELERAKYE